jgi:hypothetical protein
VGIDEENSLVEEEGLETHDEHTSSYDQIEYPEQQENDQ